MKFCHGLSACGVLGQNGGVWAVDKLTPTLEEILAINKAIGEGRASAIFGTGFTIQGHKFAATQIDDEDGTIAAAGKPGAYDKAPFYAMKTNQAIIFAIGKPDTMKNKVSTAVCAVADYLKTTGY